MGRKNWIKWTSKWRRLTMKLFLKDMCIENPARTTSKGTVWRCVPSHDIACPGAADARMRKIWIKWTSKWRRLTMKLFLKDMCIENVMCPMSTFWSSCSGTCHCHTCDWNRKPHRRMSELTSSQGQYDTPHHSTDCFVSRWTQSHKNLSWLLHESIQFDPKIEHQKHGFVQKLVSAMKWP